MAEKNRHKLTLLQWEAGFDRWALSAATSNPVQLEYTAALAHREVVRQVGSLWLPAPLFHLVPSFD